MDTKIKSTKGFLSATIEKPASVSKGVVIFLPGFLDSKDYSGFVELSKSVTSMGFSSVRFDPTGTWGSSGEIEDYSISQYLVDLDEVISYSKLNPLNSKNIILVGHSLGAAVAIIYSAMHQNISSVIAIHPPNFYGDEKFASKWGKKGVRLSNRDYPTGNKTMEYKVPVSFLEDAKRYNTIEFVSKLRSKLFLIAGEFDDKIAPSLVKEIYNKANQSKQFDILKTNHDFTLSKKETKIVCDKVVEILKGYN